MDDRTRWMTCFAMSMETVFPNTGNAHKTSNGFIFLFLMLLYLLPLVLVRNELVYVRIQEEDFFHVTYRALECGLERLAFSGCILFLSLYRPMAR